MIVLRWLLATPLLVASYCGVPVAYLVLSSYLFTKRFSRREFDLHTEVIEKAATLVGPAWPVPLALVLFAACWWMTTSWTRIALVATVPLALTGLFSADTAVVALGAVVVGWTLAWLAGRVMTWPITPDVTASAMEITVKLRGRGRLRLQSRRLLLDKLPAPLNPHARSAASRFRSIGSSTSNPVCSRRRPPGPWPTPAGSRCGPARCCGSSAAGRNGWCRSTTRRAGRADRRTQTKAGEARTAPGAGERTVG